MTREPVDRDFGIPLSEWIERIPNELEMDAVGLWQIVPVGRESFYLEGDALTDFVMRSVIALIKRGAVPVRPAADKENFWEIQTQYGKLPEEIARNVVNEWQQYGMDPTEDGLWFTLVN